MTLFIQSHGAYEPLWFVMLIGSTLAIPYALIFIRGPDVGLTLLSIPALYLMPFLTFMALCKSIRCGETIGLYAMLSASVLMIIVIVLTILRFVFRDTFASFEQNYLKAGLLFGAMPMAFLMSF